MYISACIAPKAESVITSKGIVANRVKNPNKINKPHNISVTPAKLPVYSGKGKPIS
ncbi:hypothetical protein GCM10007424_13510 [Flavobacterium suaedae]|uniref:Uncharacterized protein n=1 Tax=Flavobacterium suaedae TaxID=1767027 RepID=A0ABQ1JRX2_9FLAO|nr:hypothetical protein GCM10007424_13510 [Flavobacterium suaedae]